MVLAPDKIPYSCICCTHRSGLHEIPTMIRTCPHVLENYHVCKWTSDKYMFKLEACGSEKFKRTFDKPDT